MLMQNPRTKFFCPSYFKLGFRPGNRFVNMVFISFYNTPLLLVTTGRFSVFLVPEQRGFGARSKFLRGFVRFRESTPKYQRSSFHHSSASRRFNTSWATAVILLSPDPRYASLPQYSWGGPFWDCCSGAGHALFTSSQSTPSRLGCLDTRERSLPSLCHIVRILWSLRLSGRSMHVFPGCVFLSSLRRHFRLCP